MAFIKATIFTLLLSATAVLGDPFCDWNSAAPENDVKDAADALEVRPGPTQGITVRRGEGTRIGLWGDHAVIYGYTKTVDETTSANWDVGAAVRTILEECHKDGMVGGTNPAGGNGDFVVHVYGEY